MNTPEQENQPGPAEPAAAMPDADKRYLTRDIFTPEQIALLVASAQGDWLTAILVGFYTGSRLRDAVILEVGQIDLQQGTIRIRQRKSGTGVCIPIHPCLSRHLQKTLKDRSPDDFVCPSLANRDAVSLSRAFARIMQAAGIHQELLPGKARRQYCKFSFHSLRLTCLSQLSSFGVDLETRQAMTGHCTLAANGGCRNLASPNLRLAVPLLPDVVTGHEPFKGGFVPGARPGPPRHFHNRKKATTHE